MELIRPGFKQVRSSGGRSIQYEPVVIEFKLTAQQRDLIGKAVGDYPTEIQLTGSELKLVLSPRGAAGEKPI